MSCLFINWFKTTIKNNNPQTKVTFFLLVKKAVDNFTQRTIETLCLPLHPLPAFVKASSRTQAINISAGRQLRCVDAAFLFV